MEDVNQSMQSFKNTITKMKRWRGIAQERIEAVESFLEAQQEEDKEGQKRRRRADK